jgi:Ca-activated chloride channel family protein
MSQAEAEQMRRMQEQQQAMEQWLRRIPNDPGGLLRRKFQYQYQRMGRDQDGNALWPDDEVEPW